jgi:hypothetical protein
MPLNAKTTESSDWQPVPEGVHLARCITVVDLGLQETTWSGEISYKHQVYLAFEIPSFRVKWTKDEVEHEGPGIVGQVYTNSLGEKANLTKHLTSWRGKTMTDEEKKHFDLFTLLDTPCQVSITHRQVGDKTYVNIVGIMGLPPGVDVPVRETDLLAYTPGDTEKVEALDRMPNWMREKCEKGHKLQSEEGPPSRMGEHPPIETYSQEGSNDFNDEIPFAIALIPLAGILVYGLGLLPI